jgi:hypothetical protein
MPRVGLQLTTPVFLQAMIGHASDRAVTVIGTPASTVLIFRNLRICISKKVSKLTVAPGARRSVVVKALCYIPEGRRSETR